MKFTTSISQHTQLTLRYGMALAFVALLTLASYGLMERSVSTKLLEAKLLNVSGRQRMLCQRVNVLALRALRAEGAERKAWLAEMEWTLKDFGVAHQLLMHGPASGLGLPEGHPALLVLQQDKDGFEVLVHGFIKEATTLREALAHGHYEGAGRLAMLQLNVKGDALVPLLEERMYALQLLGEDTLNSLRTLIMLLSGAALLGLMFTGLVLIRPIVASVVRNQEQLESLNLSLETEAGTDKLTGVYNRRTWDTEIRREFAKARREKESLCMIMTDLDYFKRVNDTHGHQRGDRVLQEFVKRLNEGVRASDSVYRLGGEEFAVLLSGTDIEQGRVAAEKLRGHVAATPLDKDLAITASFGVAATDGLESPDEFFRRADQALYAAKAGGRNRVEISDKSA